MSSNSCLELDIPAPPSTYLGEAFALPFFFPLGLEAYLVFTFVLPFEGGLSLEIFGSNFGYEFFGGSTPKKFFFFSFYGGRTTKIYFYGVSYGLFYGLLFFLPFGLLGFFFLFAFAT